MKTKQTKLVSGLATNLSPDTSEDLEVSEIIESFKKEFLIIKNMGFVKSHRENNTGIGKTFEDLIGIKENNRKLADYKDVLELKCTRKHSQSRLTLFTEKPTYPKNVNTYLKDTFGQPDPKYPHLKVIHTTVSSKYNTFKDELGFKLEVDYKEKKLFIRAIDLCTKESLDMEIYYTFEVLEKLVETKCKYIACVTAEVNEIDGTEYFHYIHATILTGLTFEKFLLFIDNGWVEYDIRIGSYKSGKKIGKPHDHGSGMRVKKNYIDKVFHKVEL